MTLFHHPTTKHDSLNDQHGMMLVNLIVSIGIIALLCAVSIPYLRKYQINLKLNATARDMTTDIRYAQQLTVTEQKTHIVVFDPANRKYQILKVDIATTTIKTVFLNNEVNFQGITGLAGNTIVFNYYGGVSQPGQVVLSNANNMTADVNIKPSGYIQIGE